MTLAAARIVFQGETPYAHEREAIAFAIQTLPNHDPYQLWALLELHDPSTGRLYELDLVVLGYSALYLVEIKSGPGLYEGDYQDWARTDPDTRRAHAMENPYRLTNHKAKVLASRLRGKLKDARNMPWVEPLIFLSAENVELRFKNHGDVSVVTRDKFLRAVQNHEFQGANQSRAHRRISAPAMRDIAAAMHALGLRPRAAKLYAGAYELKELLEDGPGYQDRLAVHRTQKGISCRARTYLVPQQTSVERRQQLVRAADRESQLLYDVREHPSILRINGYETDAPLGPTVLFDPFDGGITLSAFLRRHPNLEFGDRVEIIEQVARALAFCHKKHIVHGALSLEAILVRRPDESSRIETRLFNFQLGVGVGVEATTHWSALASAPWALYQAPELRDDPTARSPQSDLFSLGALAYHLFTGQPPGESVVEVARRLHETQQLDPRAVDDGVPDGVADAIVLATQLSPVSRVDDVDEWLEYLLSEITKPETKPEGPEVDPLTVQKDETLGDDFLVHGVLGQGATSRVLRVTRVSDDREYALKVSLSHEHEDRIAAEADALRGLRHPRIVQLIEGYKFAGRSCLLLSLAGNETLHRYLAREGTVSLELAERYGDDLLSALEYLEEQQVLHRDIKPANLGVGSVGKTRAHLTLYDFSLAASSRTELEVGTLAYRDPFLVLRGAWDNAAERWSAAITLHEMLTGARPTFDGVAIDREARLQLEAERFDPSVRDALVSFFARALARETENRFALAEEMRRAWINALTVAFAPGVAHRTDAPTRSLRPYGATRPASEHPEADLRATEDELRAIDPDTLIEALPLSPRAKNALDRAGLLRADDLLALADNRLSAIRGIGSSVAKEILGFRDRWRLAHRDPKVDAKPFFAGYRGDDLLAHTAGLAESAATALGDAALPSLAAIAAAPRPQIEALAARHGFDVAALTASLERENRDANERARPSTVEGWIDALMPKKKRSMHHARQLFGIEGPFEGRLGVPVKELADAQRITPAAIYIALGKARDAWNQHAAIRELRAEIHAVLDAADGALPLDHAAEHLLARMPHERTDDERLRRARASALVRVVVEIEKEDETGVGYVRIGEGAPWLAASDAHVRAIKALGAAADDLAARPVVAGQGETARLLALAVEDTPLTSVSLPRLAELAALASDTAARSSRLEIYPRGMSADRALSLSASVLKSEVTEEPGAATDLVALPGGRAAPVAPRARRAPRAARPRLGRASERLCA